MFLPEGVEVFMGIQTKKPHALVYHFRFSEKYMNEIAIEILSERIARAKVALPLCKHTKRKHRLLKLLKAFETVHAEFVQKLNAEK